MPSWGSPFAAFSPTTARLTAPSCSPAPARCKLLPVEHVPFIRILSQRQHKKVLLPELGNLFVLLRWFWRHEPTNRQPQLAEFPLDCMRPCHDLLRRSARR